MTDEGNTQKHLSPDAEKVQQRMHNTWGPIASIRKWTMRTGVLLAGLFIGAHENAQGRGADAAKALPILAVASEGMLLLMNGVR